MNEILTLKQAKPEVQRRFMVGVYSWMILALAITTISALYTATSPVVFNFLFVQTRGIGFLAVVIAEFVLVLALTFNIRKIKPTTAAVFFIIYAITNGIMLSTLFMEYKLGSIVSVFGICTAMFLAMSIYGIFTKSNLMSAGRYLMMALFGLIIASVVNIFLQSGPMDWLISIAGVGIFVGLTAYDTQKFMKIGLNNDGSDAYKKMAIIGALELYLDFINMFLYVLRLFGKRK